MMDTNKTPDELRAELAHHRAIFGYEHKERCGEIVAELKRRGEWYPKDPKALRNISQGRTGRGFGR
jgi:hypothetical protein